ncbi:MAG: hypothetical protein IPJ17_05555 [Holophagales bacterium]|nr:MAG: hypothetical protein IPJ17_05555 [Holophagales bacterium]
MPAKPRPRREKPTLIQAFLARGPERDPRILLPRSALPLARAAFLFHGVVVRGWSLGWLAGFLFAEFFLVVRLAVLGDRFAGGHSLDPELHRRTSLAFQLAWLVVSTAALAFTGLALAASQAGGSLFTGGHLDVSSLDAAATWGVAGYVVLLFVDAIVEGLSARRAQRAFSSAAAVQASFFLVAVLLLSFVSIFLAGLVEDLLGEPGARGVFALQLVAARGISELAVLWLPLLAPRLENWKRSRRS